MTTRVYLPSSLRQLREAVVSGGFGPAPMLAHAVTERLRAAYDAGEEEYEYAALTAAAQDSLALLGDETVPRRVVVVADVATAVPVTGAEDSLVELDEVVPLRQVAAVHVDSEEAADEVAAAATAWARAAEGDATALEAVDRCLDHELGWYATQEIGTLVAPGPGPRP
jgi:hypothetical protein